MKKTKVDESEAILVKMANISEQNYTSPKILAAKSYMATLHGFRNIVF